MIIVVMVMLGQTKYVMHVPELGYNHVLFVEVVAGFGTMRYNL